MLLEKINKLLDEIDERFEKGQITTEEYFKELKFVQDLQEEILDLYLE